MGVNVFKFVGILLFVGLIVAIAMGAIVFVANNALAAYGDVTTLVGKIYDGDGGDKLETFFDFPEDLDVDTSGNFFIADTYNNVIRKIASNGIVSTVTGSGSAGDTTGAAGSAEFFLPRGVAVDSSGNVYVADSSNNKVKKISGGTVSTLVSSGLNTPIGLEVYGSTLYIVDSGNNAIKYISTSGGTISTLASAGLNDPRRIAISSNGATLYVADNGSHRILAVNTSNGSVSVVAGSGSNAYAEGTGTGASFQNVWGVFVSGNTLYVSDHDNATIDRVRKIDLTTGATSLIYQDTTQEVMIFPSGIVEYGGTVYVINAGLGTIRQFDPDDGNTNSLFAGKDRFGNRTGTASTAVLGRPYDLVMSSDRSWIYLAMNNMVRRINRTTGEVTHVIGSVVDNYRGEGTDSDPLPVRFSTIQGITINSAGTRLYVVDRWNNRIRGINLTASPIASFLVTGAGLINTNGTQNNGYQEGNNCGDVRTTGQAGCAYFQNPAGITIDSTNTFLYVTDTGNNRIRKVRLSDGQTFLVAGGGTAGYADGTGTAAKFNKPFGITISSDNKYLYVADTNNHRIRRIDNATGAVTTMAGNGSAGYREAVGIDAVLSFPEYIKMGADGLLYFTEAGSFRVRLIDPSTKLTKLIAGSGIRGFANGSRTLAEFNNLKGLAPDTLGSALFVADSWNDLVRRIDITGTAPFAEPAPTLSSVSPNQVNPAWDQGSGLQVKVNGTNFRYGARTFFVNIESEKTYVQTGTALAVKLPLSQLSPGWYDVTVRNLDGQETTLERGLGITDAAGNTPNIYYPYSGKTAETISGLPQAVPGFSFFAYASTIRGGFYVASGNVLGDGKAEVISGTGNGMGPQVHVFDGSGNVKAQFFAYASTLRTGVRVAACDVTGDGVDEIVTVPGPGGRPHVRIFDGYGTPLSTGFFALDGKFLGGAYVTCGDTDGDGAKEIIVTAGRGGGAQVIVYSSTGRVLSNFFAYDKFTFRGGIKVATVDADGDGKDEIVTGPEFGAPHIQIFQIRANLIKRLSPGFYAFSSSYRGGVSVAGADIDGDGTKEIIVGVGENAQPQVKIYNIREVLQTSFYAYSGAFLGGVNVAGGDVDGDGVDEVLTIPRSIGAPNVRVIEAGSL